MKTSTNLLLLIFAPFLLISILCIFSKPYPLPFQTPTIPPHPRLKIFVSNLPRTLNYGLLDHYWSLSTPDSRITNSDPDAVLKSNISRPFPPPYPENPLIKQYSAEYWLLGDLETPGGARGRGSAAERVLDWRDADVVFVPFFAALSAEVELGWGRRGGFGKKEGNGDYGRQREVVDLVTGSDAWKRSGGRDHVFVLTGYVKT